jgi:sec-independent protein translocase protein TatA
MLYSSYLNVSNGRSSASVDPITMWPRGWWGRVSEEVGMFGLGALQPVHLLLILAIVLVVFGAGKLGQVGGALGQSVKEFKNSVSDPEEEAQKAAAAELVKTVVKTEPVAVVKAEPVATVAQREVATLRREEI